MGLIDIVRKAQSLSSADHLHVASFPLPPFWLANQPTDSEEPTHFDETHYLVRWRPVPPVDDSVKARIDEEERLILDLNQKLEGPELPSANSLDGLLRTYLEKVSAAPDGAMASGGKAIHFNKLLRKAAPHLGQKLLSTIVRTCVVIRYWDGLQAMLASHSMVGNTFPDLVSKLVEEGHPVLLCLWIKTVRDPRFSDLLSVLKFFLKSSKPRKKRYRSIRRQWKQAALTTIARVAEMGLGKAAQTVEDEEGNENVMGNHVTESSQGKEEENEVLKEELTSKAILLAAAVDEFLPCELCLHCLVASGQDEAVLASVLSQLDTSEVLMLLHYLEKWLKKFSRRSSLGTFSRSKKDLWIPSLAQILQWISVILDEHYTTLILCSDFHSELRSMQLLVKGLVDVGYKLAPLVGIIEHIQADRKSVV